MTTSWGTRLLQKRLGKPAAVITLAAVTFALALPSAFTGFCTDDHGFRAALRRGQSPLDLFRFAPGDLAQNQELVAHGALPWWSAPELRIHFFRPLTGALFALDARLFGDSPLGYHLDSVAVYVLLAVGVALLYRRLLGGASGMLGALAFALAGAHASTYGWVAARHVELAALAALGVVALHVGGRQRGSRGWIAGAALVLAVGLGASEAAAGGALYLLAYEALGRREDPIPARLAALAPTAGVLAAYAVLYRVLHFGARGGGAYHDPFSDPLKVAGLAAIRLPVLAADGLISLPSEGANLGARAVAFLAVAGLAAMALFGWLYTAGRDAMAERERSALRWLVPGAVATMLLVAGTGIPGGRLLLVPDLGLAALVGVVLRAGFSRSSAATRAVCVLVAALHFIVGPVLALRETRTLRVRGAAAEAMARDVEGALGSAHAAFVVASDPLAAVYAKGVRADLSDRRVCWSTLAATRTDYRLTRTGERSFSLEALDTPLLGSLFETLFRAPTRTFSVGDSVDQCGATIRIADAREGRPTRLDVELHRSTDASALFAWQGGHLGRLPLPDVGAPGVLLPWEPGPMEQRLRGPAHTTPPATHLASTTTE
ncbi:MAG TPA: hypothetical protein VGI39_12670 [Polyangiaceae bacterium]